MRLDSLHDVFAEQVNDLRSAEAQLVEALPKMAGAASTNELREAFENHLKETRGHLERIELGVFNDNPRARHVYEKISFQLEGCLRDADFRQGRYRDVLFMGLLRGELR